MQLVSFARPAVSITAESVWSGGLSKARSIKCISRQLLVGLKYLYTTMQVRMYVCTCRGLCILGWS